MKNNINTWAGERRKWNRLYCNWKKSFQSKIHLQVEDNLLLITYYITYLLITYMLITFNMTYFAFDMTLFKIFSVQRVKYNLVTNLLLLPSNFATILINLTTVRRWRGIQWLSQLKNDWKIFFCQLFNHLSGGIFVILKSVIVTPSVCLHMSHTQFFDSNNSIREHWTWECLAYDWVPVFSGF